MGQRVIADRWLEFRGAAKRKQNIKGPLFEEMVHFHDHFLDDTLSTDKWTATPANGSIAVDHGTYAGGMCLFTTSTNDNESQHLGSAVCWEDDLNAICEARILITDVSIVAVFFGFSDEVEESTPDMPIDYSDGALDEAATNAAGFIVDAEDNVNGASSIVCVGVNNGTPETAIDTALDWADAKWHNLRVVLDPDGNAWFYVDGVGKGYMPTALVSGTKLTIVTAVAQRSVASTTVYVDRVDGWQDEES